MFLIFLSSVVPLEFWVAGSGAAAERGRTVGIDRWIVALRLSVCRVTSAVLPRKDLAARVAMVALLFMPFVATSVSRVVE